MGGSVLSDIVLARATGKTKCTLSPESFDELFQQEARVIEFGSPEEEAEYQKRDSQLITRIRQDIKRFWAPEESRELFVDEEWWPDHTRRVEVGMRHFTTALLTALRSLLTDEYKDYRILISVYVNRTETELYIGSGGTFTPTMRSLRGICIS